MGILVKKVKGFVLFEVAIALCVIGCVGSLIFPIVKTITNYQKNAKTQQAFDSIFRALSVYSNRFNRIPYASLSIDNGLESSSTCGEVPYKTLFLEKQVVQNGDNKTLFYVANPYLTAFSIFNPLEEATPRKILDIQIPENVLQIVDERGVSQLPEGAEMMDACAVVLISIPASSQIHLGDVVISSDNSMIIKIPPRNTGVVVRWMSRNNLYFYLK